MSPINVDAVFEKKQRSMGGHEFSLWLRSVLLPLSEAKGAIRLLCPGRCQRFRLRGFLDCAARHALETGDLDNEVLALTALLHLGRMDERRRLRLAYLYLTDSRPPTDYAAITLYLDYASAALEGQELDRVELALAIAKRYSIEEKGSGSLVGARLAMLFGTPTDH